jgi:hypothetical protein
VSTPIQPTQQTLPPNPAIPLAAEVRAAYQDLYNKIQAALDSTMDAATVEALNAWQPEVDQVLTKDDEYKLHKDTEIFEALRTQITYTNAGLKKLRGEIQSIASHFAMAGTIIAAIDKVLGFLPGV